MSLPELIWHVNKLYNTLVEERRELEHQRAMQKMK